MTFSITLGKSYQNSQLYPFKIFSVFLSLFQIDFSVFHCSSMYKLIRNDTYPFCLAQMFQFDFQSVPCNLMTAKEK